LHDFLLSLMTPILYYLIALHFALNLEGQTLPYLAFWVLKTFMQLRFERFTENLLFCPLLAHEVLKKTFGYSGLLLKCHRQQHVGRNCEVTGQPSFCCLTAEKVINKIDT